MSIESRGPSFPWFAMDVKRGADGQSAWNSAITCSAPAKVGSQSAVKAIFMQCAVSNIAYQWLLCLRQCTGLPLSYRHASEAFQEASEEVFPSRFRRDEAVLGSAARTETRDAEGKMAGGHAARPAARRGFSRVADPFRNRPPRGSRALRSGDAPLLADSRGAGDPRDTPGSPSRYRGSAGHPLADVPQTHPFPLAGGSPHPPRSASDRCAESDGAQTLSVGPGSSQRSRRGTRAAVRLRRRGAGRLPPGAGIPYRRRSVQRLVRHPEFYRGPVAALPHVSPEHRYEGGERVC